MTINVTQEDIDAGTPNRCFSCPIALAMTRAFDEPVEVLYGSAYIVRPGLHQYFALSREVTDFILYFDHGIGVEPFSFEVEQAQKAFDTFKAIHGTSKEEIAAIIQAANLKLVSAGYVREKLLGPDYEIMDEHDQYQSFRKRILSYL